MLSLCVFVCIMLTEGVGWRKVGECSWVRGADSV